MKILWGGLILAMASLLFLRHGEDVRSVKMAGGWPGSMVVNATHSDGTGNPDDADPSPQEFEALRERVRTLESEVADLKRQVRALDR